MAVPIKDNGVTDWIDTTILNPMGVLECIFQDFNEQFPKFIGANLEQFWDQVRDDDPRWNTLSEVKLRDN